MTHITLEIGGKQVAIPLGLIRIHQKLDGTLVFDGERELTTVSLGPAGNISIRRDRPFVRAC